VVYQVWGGGGVRLGQKNKNQAVGAWFGVKGTWGGAAGVSGVGGGGDGGY
jgi:hypothetical protein